MSRCWRTPLRRRGRPVRTGAPAHSARRRRSASSRPRISAVSGTAARSPRPVRRSPSSRGCCAFTARGTSRRGSSSATTRAWTRFRRRSSASSCPSSTPGRGAGAQPRRTTSGPDSGSSSRSRARRPGASAAWHIYVIRSEHVATISQALSAAEIGNRAYYTRPIHRHPAMAPVRRGARAADDRRPGFDTPGHPDESVPHRGSGDRGHALRRRGR